MHKKIKFALLTAPFIIIYFLLLSAIKSTPWIWYENRLFGLLAFIFLFMTIIIGELRVMHLNKSKFKIFKYHVPTGIFATILVLIHFVSAIFDKYKWGASLTFSQYLGFSFSDKWLVFLSLGTLAFYFMILVALTSINKMIRIIKFKRWKLIHYFSYVSFLFAFIHSINLGTDLKTSVLSVVLKPLFMIMFWLVVAILIVRIMVALKLFVEQQEVTLMAILIIIMILGAVFITGFFHNISSDEEINLVVEDLNSEISYYEILNNDLQQKNVLINTKINELRGGLNESNI